MELQTWSAPSKDEEVQSSSLKHQESEQISQFENTGIDDIQETLLNDNRCLLPSQYTLVKKQESEKISNPENRKDDETDGYVLPTAGRNKLSLKKQSNNTSNGNRRSERTLSLAETIANTQQPNRFENMDENMKFTSKVIDNPKGDIAVDREIIKASDKVKLLGVTIDNKLDFNEHVPKICEKVSTKLHTLARISNFMNPQKLRMLLKAFIESQISYCPLVRMFHSRLLNNRINKLHERALRLVYTDTNLTFEHLLEKDNSFTIHHRNIQKLAIKIYKVINNESPIIMKHIFPETANPYNLRNKIPSP